MKPANEVPISKGTYVHRADCRCEWCGGKVGVGPYVSYYPTPKPRKTKEETK